MAGSFVCPRCGKGGYTNSRSIFKHLKKNKTLCYFHDEIFSSFGETGVPAMNLANEPSDHGRVPPALLPHVHLLCTQTLPTLESASINVVTNYLIKADQITKSVASMCWQFLDAPPDGFVTIAWQPLNQLGNDFASDGYIWADQEQTFQSQVGDWGVEMFLHKAGYRPGEDQATHARRRYHLIGNRLGQPVNRNIFLIHYTKAEPQNIVLASAISLNQQVHLSLTQRSYLHQSGQLVRREFMLNDYQNYPTINLPGPQLGSNTGYPGNMPRNYQANHGPQQPAGIPQVGIAHTGVGPPPAKRQRHAPPSFTHGANQSIAAAAMANDALADEEEDVSRGDFFDQVTDREISANRYSLFHDWMEEILGSPTPTSQIVPVDLGLGRKGPLEQVTKDFVEAPVTGSSQTSGDRSTSESSGALINAVKMFRSLEETSAKMDRQLYETMKANGIPKPERFVIGMANRHAKVVPAPYIGKMNETKVERFKECMRQFNEAQFREMEENQKAFEAGMAEMKERRKIIDDEKKLRRPIPTSAEVGGKWWKMEYPDDDPHNAPDSISIHDTKAEEELLKKWSAKLGKKVVVLQDVAMVQKGGLDEEQPTNSYAGGTHSMDGTIDEDLNMSGMPSSKASRAGSQGDWVMVNDKHIEQPQNGNIQTASAPENTFPDLDVFTHNAAMPDTMSSADASAIDVGVTSTTFTPGALASTTGFDTTDFNTPDAFTNLDTAGEALAGYGEQDEIMGLDDHSMEHSSFNDAFHDGAM